MLQVRQAADQLHHDAKILDLQGRHEEATRKRKALRIAENEYSLLNQKYRTLWMRRRKRELSPNSASLSLFPNPLCPSELIEFAINTHAHTTHSLLLPFIPPIFMAPTATPVKELFQQPKTTQAKAASQPQEKITIPQTREMQMVTAEGFRRFLLRRYQGIRRGKRLELIHAILKEMYPNLEPVDLTK